MTCASLQSGWTPRGTTSAIDAAKPATPSSLWSRAVATTTRRHNQTAQAYPRFPTRFFGLGAVRLVRLSDNDATCRVRMLDAVGGAVAVAAPAAGDDTAAASAPPNLSPRPRPPPPRSIDRSKPYNRSIEAVQSIDRSRTIDRSKPYNRSIRSIRSDSIRFDQSQHKQNVAYPVNISVGRP
jgi:hypothetical protein